ncbi:hypothetical protein HRR83_007126 [Exophiala dermatitidis]|uniref:Myb-like DNA-binding protein REB1 n=2 Tax=Exophiala dermatitidis TaxID=5970 RepID=H6C4L8_EXODN|nr:myb-like DNA-binding protein REB1 [Exophiala dermatitidis NIH/UT8656]KAJ4509187.1 hypothetical protein HRR75_006158 [Exophiala dermatitidis]EHY58500.1 myb-like DNA-binding protein REB1 [Exophiala dermatitidis NIH/UT8656]KAJ4511087.1 hypothetical protein HRR73_006418 [Exophiala dermatitidis]KAJ4511978.1 hypothetical protein HRR74_006714 [Exophiala dermatitidis]KAJ4534842.1 hypothetical protein HRR76_006750 [Exophiala dermatitidis]
MGNEQSQESAARPEPETEEHFDLSEIPDDREVGPTSELESEMAKNSQIAASSSSPQQHHKKRKRKGKRNRRKSSGGTSSLVPSAGLSEHVNGDGERAVEDDGVPAEKETELLVKRPQGEEPSQSSKKKKPEVDNRSLREREPETYHIYASSDESDAEEGTTVAAAQAELASVAKSDGGAPDEHDSARGPSHVEANASAIADQSHKEPEGDRSDTAEERVPASQPDQTLEEPEGDKPDTVEEAVPATQPNGVTSVSKVPEDGRFRCPLAEEYGCEMTFARQKAATRHSGIHTSSFACSVCNKQLSRRDTLNKHMGKHTALEIASAEAGEKAGKGQETEVNGGTKDRNVKQPTPLSTQSDVVEEGSSAEFETPPQETSQAQQADEPSERQSSSPSSVFDQVGEEIVKETPMPKGGLKRKRGTQNSLDTPTSNGANPSKRRKGLSHSPPTSVQSKDLDMTDLADSEGADGLRRRQDTEKIVPTLQKTRQGSIDGWAQKYTAGSKLRHPVFNPQSPPSTAVQQVEVIIPRMSQGGPSSTNPTRDMLSSPNDELNTDQLESLGLKKVGAKSGLKSRTERAAKTASKGKKRAESGVDHSTPVQGRPSLAASADGLSDDHESEPTNLATTVAKRSFSAMKPKKQPRKQEEEGSSGSEFSHEEDGSESDIERPRERPQKRARVTASASMKTTTRPVNRARARGSTASENGRHTGQFTEEEINSLNNWRDMFCEDHNITHEQFNDMMADTIQRKKRDEWPWPFITKNDFLQDYYDVLPHRNRRSMLRYRERNFQNAGGSRNWTAEDDAQLIRLHKELGPKWAEIGRRMTRTSDAVSQRWRHRLALGHVEQGEWSKEEQIKFKKILADLRRDSGTTDDLEEWRIPWSKVSERMGTRTAQQCSNHWRVLHAIKRHGRWVKVEGLERTPGQSRILTPSKMEKRLRGERESSPTGGKRKVLSQKFVEDEDEDEEADEGQPGGPEDQSHVSTDGPLLSSERDVKELPDGQNPDQTPALEGDEATSEESANEQEEQSVASDRGEDDDGGEEEEQEGDEEPAPAPTSSEESESEAETAPPPESATTTRRNPLNNHNPLTEKKTPGKTLGSSQLFAQTQANTSALREPRLSQSERARRRQLGVYEDEDRPSPDIPIQRRIMSSQDRSPLQEIMVKENGQLDLGDDRDASDSGSSDDEALESDDDEGSQSRSPLQEIKVKENGELDRYARDSGSDDGGDESVDEGEEEKVSAQGAEGASSESSVESETQSQSQSEGEAEVEVKGQQEQAHDPDADATSSDEDADDADEQKEDDGEASDDDSSNSDDADDGDDSDHTSDDDDDDEKANLGAKTNGSGKGKGNKKSNTLNDFMASINESARRAGSGWLSRMTGLSSQQSQSKSGLDAWSQELGRSLKSSQNH